MTWTEDRVELLRKLWLENFSASRIATELGGVSRSAVIGKIHRLGLSERDQPTSSVKRQCTPRLTRSDRRPWRPASIGNTALKAEPEMLAMSEAQLFPAAVPFSAEVPVAKRLSVENLTEHTCKWPIGDPRKKDFHFCGHASLKAPPYCLYHARLAYRTRDTRTDSRQHERIQYARK